MFTIYLSFNMFYIYIHYIHLHITYCTTYNLHFHMFVCWHVWWHVCWSCCKDNCSIWISCRHWIVCTCCWLLWHLITSLVWNRKWIITYNWYNRHYSSVHQTCQTVQISNNYQYRKNPKVCFKSHIHFSFSFNKWMCMCFKTYH